ncbi:MAG TPA: rRNA maturation RNase YbeY [Candidatus Didemnitutus sp.]|nr:rRNA maturation RNase YbeY [Candidatus Didemnitutus sp.]
MRAVSLRNLHPRLRIPRGSVTRAVAALDSAASRFKGGCPPGELSIAFLTDDALARIHDEFMQDPSATDVITFEGSSDPAAGEHAAGEICVSVDTAAAFVGLRPGKAAAAAATHRFARELTLYVVHGWLHLAGYDDLQPEKKRRMRAAEKRALAILQAARCVPAFTLA